MTDSDKSMFLCRSLRVALECGAGPGPRPPSDWDLAQPLRRADSADSNANAIDLDVGLASAINMLIIVMDHLVP